MYFTIHCLKLFNVQKVAYTLEKYENKMRNSALKKKVAIMFFTKLIT